jgi:hypothetical protein
MTYYFELLHIYSKWTIYSAHPLGNLGVMLRLYVGISGSMTYTNSHAINTYSIRILPPSQNSELPDTVKSYQ